MKKKLKKKKWSFRDKSDLQFSQVENALLDPLSSWSLIFLSNADKSDDQVYSFLIIFFFEFFASFNSIKRKL